MCTLCGKGCESFVDWCTFVSLNFCKVSYVSKSKLIFLGSMCALMGRVWQDNSNIHHAHSYKYQIIEVKIAERPSTIYSAKSIFLTSLGSFRIYQMRPQFFALRYKTCKIVNSSPCTRGISLQ